MPFFGRKTVVSVALAALAGIASCREPTQITLTVTTDAQCPGEPPAAPTLVDTFIAAGTDLTPAELVGANITSQCTPKDGDNLVGTLVLIPGDGDGRTVEVVVIGGVDSNTTDPQAATPRLGADDCRALVEGMQSVQGQPCIVARRRLGFVDHKKLSLPIKLDKRCIGVECSEDKTCFGGTCVDASVTCDDEGNCADPSGEGGGGTGGAGGGGGGGGCDPITCTDDCENSAANGECGPMGCECSGCSVDGCNDFCASVGGNLTGSCQGDSCFCVAPCEQTQCEMSCSPPTAGECNSVTNICECLCDPGQCATACSNLGGGMCDGNACVCAGTCSGPADCSALQCGMTSVPDCVNGSCTCACHDGMCDSFCPNGGMCSNGACQCDNCDPVTCGMSPCNGQCTAGGCDCATCDPATCPACGGLGQVPYCQDPDTCGCQCQQTECTNDCVALGMGNVGGFCNASNQCMCVNGTSSSSGPTTVAATTSVNSSSSTGGCALSFAQCTSMCEQMGDGMVCDLAECGCDCTDQECADDCFPDGGNCSSFEFGPCICYGTSTSSASTTGSTSSSSSNSSSASTGTVIMMSTGSFQGVAGGTLD